MRIGVISQTYSPERGSASQATTIANSLAARGNAVRVVTGFPNYPLGELYPGWTMQLSQSDRVDGLAVHRTALFTDHSKSAAKRMLHYLSWAASATPASLMDLGSADVNLVFGSPATTAIPGAAAALRGAPFVLYIQDLWPDSVLTSGFLRHGGSAVEQALTLYCAASYRLARHIVVLAPGMKTTLVERGVPADKISVVMNWANEQLFRPVAPNAVFRQEISPNSSPVVMYAGNFGAFQQLDVLIDAARKLDERTNIQFVLVGSGVEQESLRRRAAGLSNVRFVPPTSGPELAPLLAAGDLHYVALPDLPHLRGTIPSKTQATMAIGRPLLAAAPGDTNELVAEADAGYVVPTQDASALAATIKAAVENRRELKAKGDNARRYYERYLSSEQAAGALESVLASAARPSSRRDDTHE